MDCSLVRQRQRRMEDSVQGFHVPPSGCQRFVYLWIKFFLSITKDLTMWTKTIYAWIVFYAADGTIDSEEFVIVTSTFGIPEAEAKKSFLTISKVSLIRIIALLRIVVLLPPIELLVTSCVLFDFPCRMLHKKSHQPCTNNCGRNSSPPTTPTL